MGSKNRVVLANQLKKELTGAGNKLLNFTALSPTEDIITILKLTEKNLSTVRQPPPKELIKPLQQIINALSAKELMRHPDMHVNILVACCISEILRITAPKAPYKDEQIKDFFELVVISFEKLSSFDGKYGEMAKVLEVFSKARLHILMLELKQDGHGLCVRLFEHFLNASDFNSTAIVLHMENIMRMIIEENEILAIELQNLLLTSFGKDNQSGSPVCWQLGEKVLNICAANIQPIDRRSIPVFDYPKMVAHICDTASDKGVTESIPFTSETSKMIDENPKIKLELPANIHMINGKRKRNNEQAPIFEHGEILVGRKIRVWRAKSEVYLPGVVKSFDCISKMHKVLLDDAFEAPMDLKLQRWMFENLSPIPDSSQNETQETSKENRVTILSSQNRENERLEDENFERSKGKQVSVVLSNEALYSNVREIEAGPAPREGQSGIICVQGYKVKNVNAPILEAILKKHGDIASTCVLTCPAVRTSLLEAVCDIVKRFETNDVTNIMSSIQEIESQLHFADAGKINVSWLQAHLEIIRKSYEAEKKATMLMELQTNTNLVERAARSVQKERHAKLVAAHANLIAAQNEFAEAERCVEVIKLVKEKLNNDVLESKAEKELLAPKPVI